jgi:hypothetical protein
MITFPVSESGEFGKKPRRRLPVLPPVIQNVCPKQNLSRQVFDGLESDLFFPVGGPCMQNTNEK